MKKILVAPLDWGLGHATRCIPLVRSLLQSGCTVFLAGEGAQQELLQTEFPHLPFLPLKGYRVQYGVSAVQTTGRLLLQLPQIKAAIDYEHRWLAQMMERHRFDAVISDNRYGLYHPQAHTILVTHQLRIQAPFAEGWLQRVHYRLLRPFREVWVPDVPQPPGLAGALSHPRRMPPVPVRYIGPLSRFAATPEAGEEGGHFTTAAGSGVLLLLSGPEPQRSIFEQLLLQQAGSLTVPVVLVRGLPGATVPLSAPQNVQVYNHLPAAALATAIKKAAFVLCRSGYSTLMDLAVLGKKSIVVPTPGQTEQAYLAWHLHRQGFAFWQHQKNFNLAAALKMAGQFCYRLDKAATGTLLHEALTALQASLDAKASGRNAAY